jgi:Tol biopolymer transport system component
MRPYTPSQPVLTFALGVLVSAAALAAGGAHGATGAAEGGPYRNGLVAFVRCCGPAGIFVIRPNGTGERRVYRPAFDDAPLDPAWSPDATQIAFVPGSPRGGIWAMRGDGSRQRRVTPGRGDPLFPSWSPGGRFIAFADLGTTGTGLHDLFRVRSNGSGLRRLTRTPVEESHPAWAPNGAEIVYERGRDLWHMRLDGSRQRLLLRNASSPSWSPGGTHVAFVRRGDPWIVARDGTGEKRVVEFERPQLGVAWSPDGRWLVCAPVDRGELMLVRPDGSGLRPLTNAPGYGHSWPSWQRG